MRHFVTRTILVLCCTVFFAQAAPGGAIWTSSQSDWNSPSRLAAYDIGTGQTVDYGAISGLSLVTDLAASADGSLYAVGFANSRGRGDGALYALTPGLGGTTSYQQLQVNGSLSGSVNAMTWHDGALYVASNNKRFYQLEQAGDGTWDVVASGKGNHGTSGDLAFGDDGTLYATVQTGRHARLATVDLGGKHFGKTKFVGKKSGYDWLMGLASVDGQMYAAAAGNIFGDAALVALDLETGDATFHADLNAPVWGMTSMGGAGKGGVVPEPTTVGLVAAGMLALAARRRYEKGSSR